MRTVLFSRRGKPTRVVVENLNELVMLTQAAISIANTRRRIAEHVLSGATVKPGTKHGIPVGLFGKGKGSAYEVTVVDQFFQLGQQSFALHGSVAMWERGIDSPSSSQKVSYKKSIDICLFNLAKAEESRIEFGFYTTSKLQEDAQKLIDLSSVVETDYPTVSSYLILWSENVNPSVRGRPTARSLLGTQQVPTGTQRIAEQWRAKFVKEALSVSNKLRGGSVELRVCSTVDLFSEKTGIDSKRMAHVALFQVMV